MLSSAGHLKYVWTQKMQIVNFLSEKSTHPFFLKESLEVLSRTDGINLDAVWVIGGNQVYQDALKSHLCHRIYLTEIVDTFKCDTFFPRFDKSKFEEVSDPDVPQELQREGDVTYLFKIYEKIPD